MFPGGLHPFLGFLREAENLRATVYRDICSEPSILSEAAPHPNLPFRAERLEHQL